MGDLVFGIVHVISAFCGTPVSQNAEITRTIPSSGDLCIVMVGISSVKLSFQIYVSRVKFGIDTDISGTLIG